MMSLIDLDDDQRWVPTHVNVTVLRARGLRTKGKHGSRYLYTIIQVGKEKYTTGLVERAPVPEWNEECCFELLPGVLEEGGRSAYPPGSGDLVLTVMHRVLIGLDVFLGQASIPLDRIFNDGMCPRDEWMKLNSKAGRKEKERGEMQVTVQFTRNNMTASMFDLNMQDKPRSAFGKLKDRVTGRKRGDVESSSAILPGRFAAVSGHLGQHSGEGGGGGPSGETEVAVEEKRSKVKDFFKGKLRRSSDTRSCSSLASESSVSSLASDNLGPPPSLDLLADPPSSPVYTSKVRVDSLYGEADLAKKVLTSQHTTKVLTHKRAFSDEASKITTSTARTSPAVEALRGHTMTQSKSSLCINGSHVYDSEPSTPRSSAALQSKLVLLEKCSPLSRSLQNLTKRGDPATSPGESRRWSFDKGKKEEREEEREPDPAAAVAAAAASAVQSARTGGRPQAAGPIDASAADGKKQKKALFSGGRSDSLPAKSEQGQAVVAAEGRLRGWFGSTDTQNKPRLEVSPKVESSSDVPPPLPPRSPIPQQFQFPSPLASPNGPDSPDNRNHSSPFSAASSPSTTPISTSNPFLAHMQRNPFFEELIAEDLRKSPPLVPHSPSVPASSRSPPFNPGPSHDAKPKKTASARRERPRPIARQISLPALLPTSPIPCSPDRCAPRSASESQEECDDFFDAFASSRLNSPKGPLPPKTFKAIPSHPQRGGKALLNSTSFHTIEEQKADDAQPPPLPPRRLLRTSVNDSDTWLHRGQQLAVQQEACLLSQTGAASRQHGREAERKRSTRSVSPDHLSNSETSESLSVLTSPYENLTAPTFQSEENLKKFRYEPLEDENDRWRGMLFEQDLYGRVGIGNSSEPKVNSALSSVAPKNANHLENNDWIGDKVCHDDKMVVSDFLGSLSAAVTKSNMIDIGDTSSILQSTVYTPPVDQDHPPCTNNDTSQSFTFEDLNMNVNDSDFTFIDSEGSSPSEIADPVKHLRGLDKVFQQPSEDILLANYHIEMSMPDQMFSTTQSNVSLETTSNLSNEQLMMLPVGEDEGCDLRQLTQQNICEVGSLVSLTSAQADVESNQDTTKDALNKTIDEDLDGNGNLQASLVTLNKKDSSSLSSPSSSSSRVVSARLRPSGMRCSANQRLQGEASEQQLPHQPSNSLQVFPLSHEDTCDFIETNIESGTRSSFEELHAKVAPEKRTLSNSKPSPSLSSSAVSTPGGLPHSIPESSCNSIHPLRTLHSAGFNSTLAVAPFTSSPSSSFPPPSTTAQPLTEALHTLLPEEIDPACNLPRQESSPHPVKPMNTTGGQSDKKEGRSVLEKLKSTIHPGRTASQSAAEPERSQLPTVDNTAQYQQLSNMELISLLLQQEMDMQKQQADSEQQGALLDKREAELKKLKLQVRDLEDYIDNLLLRIMEQTPTLLQVRARHK
ncbi:rab11 family-interacting protein 1 isoform X1 [Gadus morhua]|uniref:RAB11 family interacting protein 5b (class I) n=1 Tax=Gadus morhua TaxID=8049 RepID=A0A8C5BTM8_GADMO|nr:rab11 family-interacting protein 5 isoform X1 [Gadus morhua]